MKFAILSKTLSEYAAQQARLTHQIPTSRCFFGDFALIVRSLQDAFLTQSTGGPSIALPELSKVSQTSGFQQFFHQQLQAIVQDQESPPYSEARKLHRLLNCVREWSEYLHQGTYETHQQTQEFSPLAFISIKLQVLSETPPPELAKQIAPIFATCQKTIKPLATCNPLYPILLRDTSLQLNAMICYQGNEPAIQLKSGKIIPFTLLFDETTRTAALANLAEELTLLELACLALQLAYQMRIMQKDNSNTQLGFLDRLIALAHTWLEKFQPTEDFTLAHPCAQQINQLNHLLAGFVCGLAPNGDQDPATHYINDLIARYFESRSRSPADQHTYDTWRHIFDSLPQPPATPFNAIAVAQGKKPAASSPLLAKGLVQLDGLSFRAFFLLSLIVEDFDYHFRLSDDFFDLFQPKQLLRFLQLASHWQRIIDAQPCHKSWLTSIDVIKSIIAYSFALKPLRGKTLLLDLFLNPLCTEFADAIQLNTNEDRTSTGILVDTQSTSPEQRILAHCYCALIQTGNDKLCATERLAQIAAHLDIASDGLEKHKHFFLEEKNEVYKRFLHQLLKTIENRCSKLINTEIDHLKTSVTESLSIHYKAYEKEAYVTILGIPLWRRRTIADALATVAELHALVTSTTDTQQTLKAIESSQSNLKSHNPFGASQINSSHLIELCREPYHMLSNSHGKIKKSTQHILTQLNEKTPCSHYYESLWEPTSMRHPPLTQALNANPQTKLYCSS